MGIVVEDGTGKPNANSYASEAMLDTYCEDRAITIPAGDVEAALIRATQYIESHYRGRWPGARLKYRGLQSLSWPRVGAYTNDESRIDYRGQFYDDNSYYNFGYYIPSNEIPIELIQATCEAAINQLVAPTSAQSLAEGTVKIERAGDTMFEYFDPRATGQTATGAAIDSILEGILGPILLTGSNLFGVRDRMS